MAANITSFGAGPHFGDHRESTFGAFLGVLVPYAVGPIFFCVFFLRGILLAGF